MKSKALTEFSCSG